MWGMAKEAEGTKRPRTGEERFAAYLEVPSRMWWEIGVA